MVRWAPAGRGSVVQKGIDRDGKKYSLDGLVVRGEIQFLQKPLESLRVLGVFAFFFHKRKPPF